MTWTEFDLYQTKGGKYICHRIGRTHYWETNDRFSGAVCDTLDEVTDFFGYRDLAKELYEDAGFDIAVAVE